LEGIGEDMEDEREHLGIILARLERITVRRRE
jgi:hypothetical protein